MEEKIVTAPEAQAETTTSDSTPENETTVEAETASVGTENQPEETVKAPRSEQRIHELSKRLKQESQRADYWERLNATPPVAPTDEPLQDSYTADQIADIIMRKQQTLEIEKQKVQANNELQRDIQETLIKHPDLETNDRLSKTVFNYAQANNIRISEAAEEIKSQIKANEEKVRKEILASQSGRIGVTTPSAGKVSTGTQRIDIKSLSDEEKSANWSKVLESYQN